MRSSIRGRGRNGTNLWYDVLDRLGSHRRHRAFRILHLRGVDDGTLTYALSRSRMPSLIWPRFAYSGFMFLTLAVFLLARRFGPKSGIFLSRRDQFAVTLAAFIGAAFGSKLPFIITGGSWLTDGKTILTGMAGAYFAVEITKLWLGIRAKTGDSFALPLALAVAVGRWGCFFNGCCYGVPTSLPWAVDFGDGIGRHPTQIYESIFHLALAAVLWTLTTYGLLRYQRLKFYLIAYCVYRFVTEWIRPEPQVWLGLTFYQLAALVLAIALAIQWRFDSALLARETASGASSSSPHAVAAEDLVPAGTAPERIANETA